MAPICEQNSRDSNEVELSFAEEECLRQLPDAPQWFKTEPNSFADFGSELTKSTRSFINPSRQRRKGRTVGSEASGGFQTDFTKTSLNRLLQGFMFADAREMPTTKPVSRRANFDWIMSATAATSAYLAASPAEFAPKMIVNAQGFENSGNNGLKVVSSVSERVVEFFSRDVLFMFAIDVSTSMDTEVSTGVTRLDTVKSQLADVFDRIKTVAAASNVNASIVVIPWAANAEGEYRLNFDDTEFDEITAYLAALTSEYGGTGSGTNFNAPFAYALDFLTNVSPNNGNRSDFFFFFTDGTPAPAGSDDTAVVTAANMINRLDPFNGQRALNIYAMNIDEADLTATSKLDNTSADGVPNITGANPTALFDAVDAAITANVQASAQEIVIGSALTDEEPTLETKFAASLEAVGYQFDAGEVNFAVTDAIPSLVSGTAAFNTLANLIPGAWVFIGGDTAQTAFANNVGFARIKSVTAGAIVFDDVTFNPVTESGAGKTIRLFVGSILKNEKAIDLIKMRSYQLERTLGEGENGTQAEYLEGAVANEFSLTIPSEEKMTADLTFVACKRSFRTGNPGDELKPGERLEAAGDEVYNTTSDIYRMKVSLNNPNSANLSPLVGYVSEGSLSVTNNASPNKAVSVLGALDFQFGDFEVSGSLTAYFTDVSAPKAIEDDLDASFNIIGAYDNYGFVYDMPLLTLSGGALTIEKDAAIMLPIEPAAVEGSNGFTLLYQFFPYLPDAAMPE